MAVEISQPQESKSFGSIAKTSLTPGDHAFASSNTGLRKNEGGISNEIADDSNKHLEQVVESDMAPEGPMPERQPEPDGLDFVEALEIDDGGGIDCELHVYESRHDTWGEEVKLRVGVKQQFEPPKDRSHAAALVLTRYYDSKKTLSRTSLKIRSPYLRKALRDVVQKYPGIAFDTAGKTTLTGEDLWCLFHYRNELEEYAKLSNDSKLQSHMDLCLQYVDRKFHEEIARYNSTVGTRHANAGLEFRHLWMAFRPGDLLYQKTQEIETLVVFKRMTLQGASKDHEYWQVFVHRVQCNGTSVGYVENTIIVKKYDGFVAFTTLSIFPLRYHQDSETIKERLLERGFAVKFADGEEIIGDASPDVKVDDTMLLICHHEVPAYTLINKQWGWFNVENVQNVAFDDEGFENLVLPSDKKQLISSLIMSRHLDGFSSDDFVQGKGKGVIILLHGPPGVGKTFTAEVMADHARRPLLTANSGQFTGPSVIVERTLASFLRLATRWQALVLVDEADVFMQARDLQDLERNGIVSMLLRTLEYFEGTLFLTTNRVGTIDTAFMSRIHLALSYGPLSEEAKKQLWDTWVTRACRGKRPEWVEEQLLGRLSRLDVSGRDIKNVALLAQGLAKSGQRDMAADDILKGVAAMTQFQEDFKASVTHEGMGKKPAHNGLEAQLQPSDYWMKRLYQWWNS
ncbi:ATPase [Colletotrichum plurivorum]|uniref:ATPase n=1 Tax=Colletotrichum plurivorum TaxID=2175906 RepID=A0A8H6KND1_9PEZI|nr:ATPase [Colletotrichum plurivorum]